MKKKITTMNIKTAANSQLSTTEPKKTPKTNLANIRITETGTESQKCRSHGGLSAWRGRGKNGEQV